MEDCRNLAGPVSRDTKYTEETAVRDVASYQKAMQRACATQPNNH
jgi:hypothetical protein